MGTTVFYGAFLVLMVIVVDILYGFIDGQANGTEYTARMSSHIPEPVLREGQTYPFTVHPKDLKYFDKSSGRRLPNAKG